MFDVAWQELLLVGVIALLVVGPKELPGLLRSFGQWVNKARGMARDFQRSMDEAAREADLPQVGQIQRDLRQMTQMPRIDFEEQARRSALATQSSPAAARLTGAPAPMPTPAPVPLSGEGTPAQVAPAPLPSNPTPAAPN